MLPWAATASPATTPATAAISLASLLRVAVLRPPRLLFRLPPLLLLRAGLRAPPRAASSDGNVFWEEPDDGSGSDYEDEVEEENERRRSSRSPVPLAALQAGGGAAARTGAPKRYRSICLPRHIYFFSASPSTLSCQYFVCLEIELLLTPEEKAILDQHETPDVTKISSVKFRLV